MKKYFPFRTIWSIMGIALLAAFVGSCRSTQQAVDPKDLSYMYNPIKVPLNPRFNVYNESDDQSLLTVKFFDADLFFSEANPQGIPLASILITIKLFDITQGRTLSDTTSSSLSIAKEKGRQEYIYYFPIRVEPGVKYVAEIKILDRLRFKVAQTFVPFNTLSYNNKYNFRIQGHFGKNELFNPVLRANEYINLIYSRGYIDSLYISYFHPFKELPDPPSMLLPEKVLDYEPEEVLAIAYSDTLPLMFPREGIYLFTTGRDTTEGFTVLNLGRTYPSMTQPEEMIEPLGYLASPAEVEGLRSAVKPKVALDDFWISCGGNIDRARELIRIYYTRALYSNYYFTSYKEGWRSERGMIYIIYGPPDKVYKSNDEESWGYKKPRVKSRWGGRFSVKEEYMYFNFKKRENNFSDNDYYLSRSETLVTLWDQAIASWRKGIVFRLDNPEDI